MRLTDEFVKFLDMKQNGHVSLMSSLTQARVVQEEIDMVIFDAVRAARQIGASWEDIADKLGVTRQAAWEKYHQRAGIE